jgi:2,4-diketo-3-deoxy-L-fuconate hydrolase
MRISNQDGRAVIVGRNNEAVDVEHASGGRFGPDTSGILENWTEFAAWAGQAGAVDPAERDGAPVAVLDPARIQPVVPRPRQIFAIGLNYTDHAEEAGFDVPTKPVVFTKYASSLTGPTGDIVLTDGDVDWEVELVVIIGEGGRLIAQANAWDHIAGVTLSQDISDRTVQFEAPPAQFGMGKSFPGFSPVGPVIVTVDELADRDDIEIGCRVNGEVVQHGRTSNMVFSVPQLIERLSAVVTLLPGDIIFTGTPAGVGAAHKPPRYLHEDDVLHTWAGGIGEMSHRLVAKSSA